MEAAVAIRNAKVSTSSALRGFNRVLCISFVRLEASKRSGCEAEAVESARILGRKSLSLSRADWNEFISLALVLE